MFLRSSSRLFVALFGFLGAIQAGTAKNIVVDEKPMIDASPDESTPLALERKLAGPLSVGAIVLGGIGVTADLLAIWQAANPGETAPVDKLNLVVTSSVDSFDMRVTGGALKGTCGWNAAYSDVSVTYEGDVLAQDANQISTLHWHYSLTIKYNFNFDQEIVAFGTIKHHYPTHVGYDQGQGEGVGYSLSVEGGDKPNDSQPYTCEPEHPALLPNMPDHNDCRTTSTLDITSSTNVATDDCIEAFELHVKVKHEGTVPPTSAPSKSYMQTAFPCCGTLYSHTYLDFYR